MNSAIKNLQILCDDTGPLEKVNKERGTRIIKVPPPELSKIRFSDPDDAPSAFKLCTEAMKATFRIQSVQSIIHLIDNAVMAVTQLTVLGDVAGLLIVREYPQIPSVHPSAWEEYIWTKYKAMELTPRNTMFLHLLCWDTEYSRDVVDRMLKAVFMHDPYIHHIAFIKSVLKYPLLVPGSTRPETSFRRLQVIERGMSGSKLPALMVADRSEICPRLRVRRAVEEDNDDIVPIIELHSQRLREMYGDFYISELIRSNLESERVILVGEHNELAVAIMVLNTQINFESLEESFELSPYAGLRHVDKPPHIHHLPKDTDSSSTVSDGTREEILGEVSCTCDETFECPPADNEGDSKEKNAPGDKYSSDDMFADLFLDEEEEVEFDIVNIAPELLMVPKIKLTDDPMSKNAIESWKETASEIPVPEQEEKKTNAFTEKQNTGAEYIIRYSGPSNAFLLELFAIHPDYDERMGIDILEAAYELFPDRDYCVTCLPSNHVCFPLLEHFTLVTPNYTRLRFINDSLFVAHVNSVRGNLSVRLAELADKSALSDLLEHVPRRREMADLIEQTIRGTCLYSLMLLAEKQPIGVVVVGPLEGENEIRTQYELAPDPRFPGNDGNIIAGVMSPAFEPHGRWFLREIMRRTPFATLFWLCQPVFTYKMKTRFNMMSLAEKMVPVQPHRFIPNLSGHAELDSIFSEKQYPFSVWMIDRPLTSLPKVYVNRNIVVVGASITGLSFIENLIMGHEARYLTFTNITLVSEHGLPAMTECLKAADMCIPSEGRYSDYYIKTVPFSFYIDIIPAVVNFIDRKQKCIHFLNGGIKFYDELVITCGQQFQHPDYLKEPLERAKEALKGKPCERILMDDLQYKPDRVPVPPDMPYNLFVINSLLQANLVFRRLLRMLGDTNHKLSPENPIIVYGDCIDAYSCIAALMEFGVSSKEIVFVENFPPDNPTALRVNCFNDELVDERVHEKMTNIGIRIMYKFRLMKTYIHRNYVKALLLMDALHCKKVECFALFFYGLKSIDIRIFKAINECGIVYDGGLVVGPSYETNDPFIFAAGTCCNYSRRLYAYASHRNHRHYNSEDVGRALADLFLRRMDPFVSCHPDYQDIDSEFLPRYSSAVYGKAHPSIPDVTSSRFSLIQPGDRRWQPVMRFTTPIVKFAVLPGPLYYMKVRRPGEDVPFEAWRYVPHLGHTLTTDKNGNYFHLHIDNLHCVNFVTCLSNEPFEPELISQLSGKHEAFFNGLLLRFQINQIDDLYSYFRQPWMAAIYHESFKKLLTSINYEPIGVVYDIMRSRHVFYGDESWTARPQIMNLLSNDDMPHYQEVQTRKRAAFRSAIDTFIEKSGSQFKLEDQNIDVYAECGQCAAMRKEAASYWNVCNGDDIVFRNVAKHLTTYGVPNPQYAQTDSNFFEQLSDDEV